MKELSIAEVFCEIVSGLSLVVIAFPLADLLDLSNLSDSWTFLIDKMDLSGLTIVLVISYLLGIIVDSIGLTIGEIFLDDLVFKEKPSTDQKSCFWNKAGDHVLKYRDSQWAYYSCYRNLFILSALAIILFGVCLFKNGLVFFRWL